MDDTLAPIKKKHPKPNFLLIIGSILVLAVLLLALFGKLIAPKDPMQESYIAAIGDRFTRPPFAPFVIEGYPLGSDEIGRDTLSRLLWAVQPSLTLVLVVAALRLLIGTVLGMISGWSASHWGRLVETLTSFALSAPVIFAALLVIASAGDNWGVWAFILGLVITGWADTARMVHTQTRLIKNQLFIEASRSLGADTGELILGHLVPNLLPRLLVQLTFEISSAMLMTACLGFLGYFINAVWIPIDDWTGLRASGLPELGQMLGVASTQNLQYIALFAGIMIVFIILSFNLLGEGLQRQFTRQKNQWREAQRGIRRALSDWLEERLYLAVAQWQRTLTLGLAALAIIAVIWLGGYQLWQASATSNAENAIVIPGGHQWAMNFHDAQGTRTTSASAPQTTPQILWQFADPALAEGLPLPKLDRVDLNVANLQSLTGMLLAQPYAGFTGSPAVDANGVLYLASNASRVYAVSAQGDLLWQAETPAAAFGTPALAQDGTLRVTLMDGSLACISTSGVLQWVNQDATPNHPIESPVVDSNGITYFATGLHLLAVEADGSLKWKITLPTYSFSLPRPRITLDGSQLIFENFILDATNGKVIHRQRASMTKFVIGSDGNIYFREHHAMSLFSFDEAGEGIITPKVKLDERPLALGYRFPNDGGVLPSGHYWFFFDSPFEIFRLVVTDGNGGALKMINAFYAGSLLLGFDSTNTAYACAGRAEQDVAACWAHSTVTGNLLWDITLQNNSLAAGGAIVEGRIYVTFMDGVLVALGSE